MNGIRVPGVIYSLLLALGAWLVDYFTTGDGSNIAWAPILLAAVPIVLKMITVNAPPEVTPMSDFGGPSPQRDSKANRLLFG